VVRAAREIELDCAPAISIHEHLMFAFIGPAPAALASRRSMACLYAPASACRKNYGEADAKLEQSASPHSGPTPPAWPFEFNREHPPKASDLPTSDAEVKVAHDTPRP
jgi:hypothetical protein